MDILDVKKDIREKHLKPFYIFTGEEIGIMSIYIKKMAETIGTVPTELEKMSDILTNVSGNSLFNQKKLFVVRDDAEFVKHEERWSKFFDGSIQRDNIVILVLYTLDKRSKLYKAYSDTITEFKRLNESVLSVYVQREIDLSDSDVLDLLYVCESDYSRTMLEIDKIKQYAEAKNITPTDAFDMLLKDGTIYIPPQDAVFDCVSVILKRKPKKAYELLKQSYDIGENPLVLLSVLYTNAKQVLQAQSADTGADLSKITDMTQYQIRCAKEKAGFYKNRELVRLMRLIQDTEKKIKMGEIEADIAMDYVLANLFR